MKEIYESRREWMLECLNQRQAGSKEANIIKYGKYLHPVELNSNKLQEDRLENISTTILLKKALCTGRRFMCIVRLFIVERMSVGNCQDKLRRFARFSKAREWDK
ncbi:MAG: hypothetical protein U5K79_06260 [Cyclobacteriaceae bacterium]|nr:hypothetical protein [Cyclobacteriaceae bacterium]